MNAEDDGRVRSASHAPLADEGVYGVAAESEADTERHGPLRQVFKNRPSRQRSSRSALPHTAFADEAGDVVVAKSGAEVKWH